MTVKKEAKKKVEPSLEDRIDAIYDILSSNEDTVETIYEILSQHKIDIEYIKKKIEEQSSVITKVRGRMGI